MSSYDWAEFEAAVDDIARRPEPPQPRRLGSARAGALAGALLLGMQEAIQPSRDRVPMEAPAPRRRRSGPIRLLFDPSPRRTVAVVREAVTPPS